MSKLTTKRTASELMPNDVICVFGDWFRVRCLNFWGGNTTFCLQRESDELSPLNDLTCMSFTVHSDLTVWVEVEVKP